MDQKKYGDLSDENLNREIMSLENRANVLEGRISRPKDYPTDDPAIDAISLKYIRQTLEEMHEEQKRRWSQLG